MIKETTDKYLLPRTSEPKDLDFIVKIPKSPKSK